MLRSLVDVHPELLTPVSQIIHRVRAALPKTKVPTLGVFGARDNLSWPDVSARVDPCRELMPAMHIELIPDAGHWVSYERRDPVNRLLIEFFKHG